MFRDTTRSVSRKWPERCSPTGHESCCQGECFSLVQLGPDGAAGRRGKGAISATPTRPPRPDFGLDAFESRATGRLPSPRRSGPYFFLQRMESHGSGTVTRLVKIRHFLNLIARRDRVKKGGCHCR